MMKCSLVVVCELTPVYVVYAAVVIITCWGCGTRGATSIGLSGLEPPFVFPKWAYWFGPTVYGCTIAWPDKLKLHEYSVNNCVLANTHNSY